MLPAPHEISVENSLTYKRFMRQLKRAFDGQALPNGRLQTITIRSNSSWFNTLIHNADGELASLVAIVNQQLSSSGWQILSHSSRSTEWGWSRVMTLKMLYSL